MVEFVRIEAAVADHVSVAFHQNEMPLVAEIVIENDADADFEQLTLTVVAEPAFADTLTIALDRLAAKSSRHISPIDIPLDAEFLRHLTETTRGALSFTLSSADQVLGTKRIDLAVLPPAHWGGTAAAPELLAAFVRPNDPAIDIVLHDAASRLAAAGRPPAIEGYAAGSRERVWEVASAIWAAIAAQGLTYVLPPASFERHGQKVRGPSDILSRKTGTCLDLTLLFAAAFEQAGLNAVLVLTEGHAFVGLWLGREDFAAATIDDMQVLRKRRDLEELIFIETTLLTEVPAGRFGDAVRIGAGLVAEGAPALEVAIDLARARSRHIRPLDLGPPADAEVQPTATVEAIELDIELAPAFADDVVATAAHDDIQVDRLERWKRKLLDLSLRNKLLNFRETRKGIALDCPDPGALEDRLKEDVRFKLLPRTDLLAGDGRSARLFAERHHDDGRSAYLVEALAREELHTGLGPEELEERLLDLYRVTRSAFEEGGSNILFLAMGFLTWTQREGGPPIRAPLLLIPVSLQRTSVRAGFRLTAHDEETRFNPTLLQMLRQDFKLVIPELDAELPTDKSGIDVGKVLRLVRAQVKHMRGWEVTADVVLSTFSFTKFLMWRDLVERMEVLKRNPVVRHLIDTPKQQYGDGLPFPDPRRIDTDYHPADIFAPLSADSSQLAAVLSAAAGKDFVLFGPPGTGKSQTIANMISQCLADGRTVLFVSQKTAALEVVQRRLSDIGLDEYCLEVHSTKAQKSAVLAQLKHAWHERAAPLATDWASATDELRALRDELNALVFALHRTRDNGMHAQAAFGRVVAHRDRYVGLKFNWGDVQHISGEVAALKALVRDMRPILTALGPLPEHPLRGLAVTDWDPRWRSDMEAALDATLEVLGRVKEVASTFARVVGLPVPRSLEALEALLEFGSALIEPAARNAAVFLGPQTTRLADALADLTGLAAEARALGSQLRGRYRRGVNGLDLGALLAAWVAASQAHFVLRGSRQRKVMVELQPHAEGPLPEDIGSDIAVLIELKALAARAELLAPAFKDLPIEWAGLDTELVTVTTGLAWAKRIRDAIAACSRTTGYGEHGLVTHVVKLESQYRQALEDQRYTQSLDRLKSTTGTLRTTAQTLADLAGTTIAALLGTGEEWPEDAIATLRRWRAGLGDVSAWAQWNRARARATQAGLGLLVSAVESAAVPPDEIEAAFDTAYARWWADTVVAEDPVLRDFLAARHEDTIARFRALDARVAELSKRIVRARLAGSVPSPTAFGTDPEWGTLSRELQKRSRHRPLRQLFSAIPNALGKLTPCVMMSPLSIAQYLPAEAAPFDVVIFDEASQIPVWDAIGAMARGRQVIIVGDPEQLPPTSVGERGVDEIEDGSDVEDQESILDEALVSNVPRQHLDWHYRSRHESLIAFSNAAYYQGRLVTFPSPVTDDRAVRYVHVPDGVYERGGGRVNRVEAAAVVAEVVRRLLDPAFAAERRSIGVVTFNGEQMRLIENLLERERRSHPEIEPFFDSSRWHEPVFVKNLENVQGDERDIVFFSVAVGPDQSGRIASTVSSLNREGGHRRLNVAITRARREMVVFATLRPEQIDLSRSAARGVREFKHFLEYAERGVRAMGSAVAPVGEATDAPFEQAVRTALEARGWIVRAQVGISGYRIDLAVVDPDQPERFLAGIECDGTTYLRAATARDRDRLRAEVLSGPNGLGWRILRVWSADWWMRPDEAAARLDAALRAGLDADRLARTLAPPASPPALPPSPLPEPAAATDTGRRDPDIEPLPEGASLPGAEPDAIAAEADFGLSDDADAEAQRRLYADRAGPGPAPAAPEPASPYTYRRADLVAEGFRPEPTRFYDPAYRPLLRSMAISVLATEAPVYEELLVQRIARAHGFARAGSSIRDALASALSAVVQVSDDDGRRLLWPPNLDIDALVPYRSSAPQDRSHQDIPICELASLALRFVSEGADRVETVRRMSLDLGFERLHPTTSARFERAYERAKLG